eukprot:13863187-Alexandrium_andersonii.AAC.1
MCIRDRPTQNQPDAVLASRRLLPTCCELWLATLGMHSARAWPTCPSGTQHAAKPCAWPGPL